jgi:hypothetical protein
VTQDILSEVAARLRTRLDVPAIRGCLRCGTQFHSEGFNERICRRCKSSASWLSSVPSADGRARRRNSRSSG